MTVIIRQFGVDFELINVVTADFIMPISCQGFARNMWIFLGRY